MSWVNPFPVPGHGHMFSAVNSLLILNELKTYGKSLVHLCLCLFLWSLPFLCLNSLSSDSSVVVSVTSVVVTTSDFSLLIPVVMMVLVRLSSWVVVEVVSSSCCSISLSTFWFPPPTASGFSSTTSSSSTLSSPSSSFSSASASSVAFPFTGGSGFSGFCFFGPAGLMAFLVSLTFFSRVLMTVVI